jgi:hypothetical protein
MRILADRAQWHVEQAHATHRRSRGKQQAGFAAASMSGRCDADAYRATASFGYSAEFQGVRRVEIFVVRIEQSFGSSNSTSFLSLIRCSYSDTGFMVASIRGQHGIQLAGGGRDPRPGAVRHRSTRRCPRRLRSTLHDRGSPPLSWKQGLTVSASAATR